MIERIVISAVAVLIGVWLARLTASGLSTGRVNTLRFGIYERSSAPWNYWVGVGLMAFWVVVYILAGLLVLFGATKTGS